MTLIFELDYMKTKSHCDLIPIACVPNHSFSCIKICK